MTRRRPGQPGQPGSTRAHQQLPADVADLLSDGALPTVGVKARLRFPGTTRYMEGLVDGYSRIDGALHVRLARAERDETGGVRAIRRTIRWATVEACSWDVAPTRRDELNATTVRPSQTEATGSSWTTTPACACMPPVLDGSHPAAEDVDEAVPA